MKRILALAAALCLVFSLSAAADFAPAATATPLPGYTLRASADEVKVFAAKSMKANIVGYLLPDGQQEVHVLQTDGDWCYISFTSVQGVSWGYVPLSCFDVAAEPSPTPAPTADSPFGVGVYAWIVNSRECYRLNLREGPSATAKSLGRYYTGTPVTLTGQVVDGFAQVLLAGTTLGWLDVRFLSTDSLSFVPEMPTVTIQNRGSGANLRSGPATTYSRLAWYGHGTAVTVLGVREDGWYHVMVDDRVGFIAASLLSGSFPYGTDSDDPLLSDNMANGEAVLYINTRSTGGQLNLRKAASTTSKSLGLFYTGTPVTVISYTRTGWACVQIGQTQGYIDADYLTATKPTQYGEVRIVRNSRASGLNLRKLPSTGGELLGFAENYSRVTVLGDLSDGWCYVQYGDTLGYMMGTYLEPAN